MPEAAGRAHWRLEGPDGPVEIKTSGRFRANSAQVLLKAAVAGLGVALLPDIMATPYVRKGELTQLLPEFGIAGVNVNLVYLSRRQLPLAVTAFIDFMTARLVGNGLIVSPGTDRSRTALPSPS
jgi:LysR family transcriptional regulator AphB